MEANGTRRETHCEQFLLSMNPVLKHAHEADLQVFSAWASSLEIVQTALTANQIKWTTIGHKKAQKTAVKDFATNDCQVFLLHGERQVSGLTLWVVQVSWRPVDCSQSYSTLGRTAAAVVHLLEPVMNQGYELQGRSCSA